MPSLRRAALALRRLGIARRTALATLILAALLVAANLVLAILTGFSGGLPPLVPLIPAFVLGLGLLRTRQGVAAVPA